MGQGGRKPFVDGTTHRFPTSLTGPYNESGTAREICMFGKSVGHLVDESARNKVQNRSCT